MASGPDETPKTKPAKKTANKFQALWEAKVENFTDDFIDSVALNRGLDARVFRWLKENNLVGLHNSKFVAFPVHDDNGNVVRCHYKDHEQDTWYYEPKGAEKGTQSLIIGKPSDATTTFILESQWDAFALMSALQHWDKPTSYAYIITRGASSNTDVSKHVTPNGKTILIPQNDPIEKRNSAGKTPAEQWLDRCKSGIPASVTVYTADTPDGFEDPNDWISKSNPKKEEVITQFITKLKSPTLLPYFRITDLTNYPIQNDPNAVIGTKRRYLCKGGSLLIVGPSGAGKSTLMASMATAWGMGRKWNGIDVVKPLRQIVIQAENDQGDIAEMCAGTLFALNRKGKMQEEDFDNLNDNLIFIPVSGVTGADFIAAVERQVIFHNADVVWIDPALSYIGGDISKQEVSSHFFRELLDPMLKRTSAIAIIMHHTGKPSKQEGKTRVEQSVKELAYSGLGSSDLVNWARAVMVLAPTSDPKVYRLMFSKRGERACAIDANGTESTDTIHLRQGGKNEGLSWTLCNAPTEDLNELKKSDREALEFRGVSFPIKWDDLLKFMMNSKKMSYKNAHATLARASACNIISCAKNDGWWTMGEETVREQPEF
jgi:hypothetical protein